MRPWGPGARLSVSLYDALSRLTCAGWLPQDRVFGWSVTAGLKNERDPKDAHSPEADRSTRWTTMLAPTASSRGAGSVGQHRQ